MPVDSSTGTFQPLGAVHEQGVPVKESAIGTSVVLQGEYISADELYVPGRLQVSTLLRVHQVRAGHQGRLLGGYAP